MSTTTASWGALRKFNGTALTHARKWLTVLSAVLMLTGSFLISGCGGVHENHADDLHIAVIDRPYLLQSNRALCRPLCM